MFKGTESYWCNFISENNIDNNIGLHLNIFELTYFKLCMITDITRFYILIPVFNNHYFILGMVTDTTKFYILMLVLVALTFFELP